MNTFEHRFKIENIEYFVYIDSSKDEFKRIVINNQEVVNEKYTLAFNRKAYIIYYPIDIGENELVISIDDNPLWHEYNIFLNGISLLDGTKLNNRFHTAELNVNKGWKVFWKENWFKILKENLFAIIGSIITWSVIEFYTFEKLALKLLLALIFVPLVLPVFIYGEWVHNKNIIKKYKNCFRPKVNFK